MLYQPVLSFAPPAPGQSKRLYSPDLFDASTGTYPKANPPAACVYPKDTQGRLQFYEGSAPLTLGQFLARTADDLLDAVDSWNGFTPRPDKGAIEMERWTRGIISFLAGEAACNSTYPGGSSGTFYPDTNPPVVSRSLLLAGTVYPIASVDWNGDIVSTYVTERTEGADYSDYRPRLIYLQGSPNLSTRLHLGDIIYWV